MTISYKQIISISVVTLIATIIAILYRPASTVYGSTSRGSDYQGTTTTTGGFGTLVQVQSTNGTLGSVVVTGAAAGVMNLYDATTTDINKRTGQPATSTILIATMPANTAAGTYTFDRSFYNGLYVEIIGTTPTTTITYRQ